MKKRFDIAVLVALTVGIAQSSLAQQSTASSLQRNVAGLFSSSKEDELVEPDQAFKLKVDVKGPNTLLAELAPAKGYYLYKERIRFSLKEGSSVAISAVKLSTGEMKTDQIFGKTEVYRKPIPVEITLKRGPKAGKAVLVACYQGVPREAGCLLPADRENSQSHATLSN